MCMKLAPQQLKHDHTHFQRFYKQSNGFLEKIFIWPFELNSIRASAFPILNFNLNFDHKCNVALFLAHTSKRVLTLAYGKSATWVCHTVVAEFHGSPLIFSFA